MQDEFRAGHLTVLEFLRRGSFLNATIEANMRNWANNVDPGGGKERFSIITDYW